METITTAEKSATVHVRVRFAAAPHPFDDPTVERTETLGVLKLRVLAAFGLIEGQQPDGNSVQYFLYHNRQELTDLSRTVGDEAGHADALELKLAQVVTQGAPTGRPAPGLAA